MRRFALNCMRYTNGRILYFTTLPSQAPAIGLYVRHKRHFISFITGPPNGPVLFRTLSASSVVVCNARGRSAAAGPGALPVRRPTLQGGAVR